MKKIIDSIWGNSLDGSLSGIVIVEDDIGKRRAFLGSKQDATTEEVDAEYIAGWGNELRVDDLMRLMTLLEKRDDYKLLREIEKQYER